MVIGVKCADQLATNHIPVMFSKGKNQCSLNLIMRKNAMFLSE